MLHSWWFYTIIIGLALAGLIFYGLISGGDENDGDEDRHFGDDAPTR